MRDAYIVTSIRTPGCKRNKGAFKDTRPEDLLTFILEAVVEKTKDRIRKIGVYDNADVDQDKKDNEVAQDFHKNISRYAG